MVWKKINTITGQNNGTGAQLTPTMFQTCKIDYGDRCMVNIGLHYTDY